MSVRQRASNKERQRVDEAVVVRPMAVRNRQTKPPPGSLATDVQRRREAAAAARADIEQLVGMGLGSHEEVEKALDACNGNVNEAANRLLAGTRPTRNTEPTETDRLVQGRSPPPSPPPQPLFADVDVQPGRNRNYCPYIMAGVILLVLLLIYSCLYVVPVGHVGVVNVFGSIHSQALPPGSHFYPPVGTTMIFVPSRRIARQFAAEVITSEGLSMTLEMYVIHKVKPDHAVEIIRTVGVGYESKVINPQIMAVLRGVGGDIEMMNLFNTKGRDELTQTVEDEARQLLGPRGIEVLSILLTNVRIPDAVEKSIQVKMEAQQLALGMTYKLQGARTMAKIREVKATGIATAQRVINKVVTDRSLKWMGVDMTKKVATTCNPKLVLIGDADRVNVTQAASKAFGMTPAEIQRMPVVDGRTDSL